jgi:hypothetical protein
MNLRMGSQIFSEVQIPLLWGNRAIIQDKKNRLSVIDLSGKKARIEILADAPASGVAFEPTFSGFKVIENGVALYLYEPELKRLESLSLGLPVCEVTPSGIRIGASQFSNNYVRGYGVGMAVTPEGISIGAPLPPGLAQLTI